MSKMPKIKSDSTYKDSYDNHRHSNKCFRQSDTTTTLPKSDNDNEYAVTRICNLTKYLVAIPIANKSTSTVAKAIFESFILRYNEHVHFGHGNRI